MCTLTFVPLESGPVITANRDESPLRNAHSLSSYYSALGEEYFIAEEPLRGGTNIAIGRNKRTAVLLNGAFHRHDMNKTYGLSRGIVVLKSLDDADLFAFADRFDFDSIQPFTLVHFADTIQEIRWDGNTIHRIEFDTDRPRLWASAQMYTPEVIARRQQWFDAFLAKGELDPESIADFHLHAGDGDPANDLVMHRGGVVQTVSVTQVFTDNDSRKIRHWDLVEENELDYVFQ